MLNRLYIVVGIVAILLLAAAFVVPAFVPWGQFRDRMEAIAAEALGTPVRIEGDIHFALLPQPRLSFGGISAGPAEAPVLTAEAVEADFSLIDFLRDHYVITTLKLERPKLALAIGTGGTLETGLAAPTAATNITVAHAELDGGEVRITDQRSGKGLAVTGVSGMLELEGIGGPLTLSGSAVLDGVGYAMRLNSGAVTADGAAPLSASVRPLDQRFSLALEGSFKAGAAPAFAGTLTYRLPPPRGAADADAGRGDLLFTSRFEASPARLLFSDYALTPDENRATTRLSGAAEVTLGADASFNAVISGGAVALPPRDATTEQPAEPYELLRLLSELPLPPVPPLPGTIGVDLNEVDLRAVVLRNVRLDAAAHDGRWSVRTLTAQLPGETVLKLSGEVTPGAGHPEFSGNVSLRSARPAVLAAAWRKAPPADPLVGIAAALEARVDLVGDTLSLSAGRLGLGEASVGFETQIGFGSIRDLHLSGNLGMLDGAGSAALLSLLPDPGHDAAFAASFPVGAFNLSAEAMTIDGITGSGLSARGSWEGGVLVADQLAAADFGGARLDLALTAFGSFDRPELSGSGTVTVAKADAPLLARLYGIAGTPPNVRAALASSFPADLALRLDAPSGDGAQSLSVVGTAGPSEMALDAQLAAGALGVFDAPLVMTLDLKSGDAAAMSAQLGLGDISPLFGEGPMHLIAKIDGDVSTSLETTALLSQGSDSVGFSGNLVVDDPDAYSGKGKIKFALSDPSVLAERLGIGGLGLPGVAGSGTLEFDGERAIRLTELSANSAGEPFSGSLSITGGGTSRTMSGELTLGRLDLPSLLQLVAGPAALLQGPDTPWPDGPLATGDAPRTTGGRVTVSANDLGAGLLALASKVSFTLDWDATNVRVRDAQGSIGGGLFGLDLTVCCAGPLGDKRASGRLSLADVDLAALVPPAVATGFKARIDAAGRFDGTGGSVADIMGGLTGEGTYTLRNVDAAGLDPGAIAAVASLDGLLDIEAGALTKIVEDKLTGAAFRSPGATGSFTIAGGVLRSPNLSIEGEGGALFGNGTLRLGDLGLSGDYALTSTAVIPAAVVDPGAAQISTHIGGSLTAPERSFDVSNLVDAVMVKAYEAEVARLEKLKAEQDARRIEAARQAVAEQQQRDIEMLRRADQAEADAAANKAADEARRAADEAAAKAKADAAAKQKADEEALRKALEEQASQPLDLGI